MGRALERQADYSPLGWHRRLTADSMDSSPTSQPFGSPKLLRVRGPELVICTMALALVKPSPSDYKSADSWRQKDRTL